MIKKPRTAAAYKILSAAQWAQFHSDGEFARAPVDMADAYIHFWVGEQLEGTLNQHFTDAQGNPQEGLVIAEIDLTKLDGELRWEISRGGALFPHLYGAPLSMPAVTGTWRF